MVGVGSPTELQGSRTSFIQGVVTVPPNEMILAGAGGGEERKNERCIEAEKFNKKTIRGNCINIQAAHKTSWAIH